MNRRPAAIRSFRVAAIAAAVGCACGSAAIAETITVMPGGTRLQTALAAAKPGDRLSLKPGTHRGPVIVDRRVSIEGQRGAVIDGNGDGSVVTVNASGVLIRGVTIRGSGTSLAKMHSGIMIAETAANARIERNRLEGNLFGVYLLGPKGAEVRNNVVIGRRDLRENERGNGIQLWRTPGSKVVGNDIRYGRDGIYTETSRNNVFRGNRFRDLRFAIHYMYTHRSVIEGNVSIGNDIGYAIMFSRGLTIRNNLSAGDRDRGLLLNYANRSQIDGNIVAASAGRPGPEKCVFLYNANKNRLSGNRFEGCRIGIHFTAGSERNAIFGNAFVGNRRQVKYVGTRSLDWGEGRPGQLLER